MKNYKKLIESLNGKILAPQSTAIIEKAKEKLNFSEEIKDFFMQTNGMYHEQLRVLPLFDKSNPKLTWDSIERANDITTTKFNVDENLLKDFAVFAELEGLTCAMVSKEDGKIWYEDSEGFHRTKLSLEDFIANASKCL
jgi:hypothetical protein